ncbi:polysaccharide pyruvyl transferase family protein [Prolixibacter bellariivorans]|uniref:polysaccharide pyruvyl transferase family protein n=1 Tax=Prolixibacter bellariivorans TaxID=314319 RepID=UPI00046EB6BF|nr:polysaccharide pyruvyl transferase family protein [Prolixibacter bellariivorans]
MADKTYWSLTPDEWVSLIASADFFYTDSFHGVVFGVKSNVNLLAYYVDEKRKSRFVDLSVRFNLKSNIVNSVSEALARNCINRGAPDYELTHKIIREERIISKAFLKKALGTEKS